MATFLDLSLFAHFGIIFVILMVFVVVYGFLLVTKMFKGTPGEKGIYALIALSVAVLAGLSKDAFSLITNLVPWFVGLVVFLFLIFLVVRMFAGDDDDLFKSLIKQSPIYWVLIVLFIVILIVGLSSTFGQRLLEQSPDITNQTIANDTTSQITPSTNNNPSSTTQPTAQNGGSSSSNDFGSNVLNTLTHPKVLGMLLMLFIAFFTILFMSGSQETD